MPTWVIFFILFPKKAKSRILKFLENVFPIATLDEKERMAEITKIEKEKNEETFGVLQNVNPEIKNSNKSLEFIK